MLFRKNGFSPQAFGLKVYRRIPRALRFWWQRRTRGWDDSETWSLDSTIARFVAPRLRRLREIDAGYPGGLTKKKWQNKLDEMIFAMDFYATGQQYEKWGSEHEAEWKRVHAGMITFGRWFGHLWW